VIPLATREQVRALDADAIDRLGVPGLVLMENAGASAARIILERAHGSLSRVLIVGGVGQNGGDAWVVARKLLTHGVVPRCMLVGERDKVKGDAAINLSILLKLGLAVEAVSNAAELLTLQSAAANATLIVDGMFGTGLDRPLAGLYAEAVKRMNAGPGMRVALDLPSGIDANTGQVLGIAIEAAMTITFAAHKRGLHQHPGVRHAGELHCVDIGVPVALGDREGVLEASDVARVLKPRAADAHKGVNGHVLVIAGSPGKTGAALLSALGSLRAGAGLVTIATHAKAREALDHKVLEIMTASLDPAPDAARSALLLANGKTAAVLGPGLGVDHAAAALARELAVTLPIPCVVDADALTALSTDLEQLRTARAPRILTPHPGEAARLLGRSTQAVQADRYGAALELAHRSAQTVVLKGARTVTASPEGALRVCAAGTPALGVAGTGDVLAGLIGALLCQVPAFEAAWAAVLLHAMAGERAAIGDRGVLASEVAEATPLAMQACFRPLP